MSHRLKALRETGLASLVAGVSVDDPIAVWSAVCDLAGPHNPPEARKAAYAVASAILGFDGACFFLFFFYSLSLMLNNCAAIIMT